MRVYTRQSGSSGFNTTIYDREGNWSLPVHLTVGGTVTANGTVLTGDQTLPTDFVSAANGGTFNGALAINADVTINGDTNNGAVTPRTLNFTTNATNAGLSGASEYLIGEVAFTGMDSSTNAAGKYVRIKGSLVDGNTLVQGSGGEGGKLQFTLLRHDAGAQPRVEYDILTLQPTLATFAGDINIGANYIGRDSTDMIDFSSDNQMAFRANNASRVTIDAPQMLSLIHI